jgi:hypothetical protein
MTKYSLTHPTDKAQKVLESIDRNDEKGRTTAVGMFLKECGASDFQVRYISAAEFHVNSKEPFPKNTIGRIKEYCDIEEVK